MKNWLIRTKSFHLLGPVSQDKVKELIDNGSITGEDEVCSGNGYWFSIKEADLVSRYIYDTKSQTFNVVSEALNEKLHREHLLSDLRKDETPEFEIKDDVTQVVRDIKPAPENQSVLAPAVLEQAAPKEVIEPNKLVIDREKTTEFYLPTKEPTIITKLSTIQEKEKKEITKTEINKNEIPKRDIPKVEITRTDIKLNSSGLIKVPKAVAVHRKTAFYKFIIIFIVAIVAVIALNRIVIFDFLIKSSHADVIDDNLKKKTYQPSF